MKHFKKLLGVLGAILAIPLLILFIIIINKLGQLMVSIAFFKIIGIVFEVILMLFFLVIIIYGGYKITTEFLEKHFKYFNKDNK